MNMFLTELKKLIFKPSVGLVVLIFILLSAINILNNRSDKSNFVRDYVNANGGTFVEKKDNYIRIFNQIEEKRAANPRAYGVGMPLTPLELSITAENELYGRINTMLKANEYRTESIVKLRERLGSGTQSEIKAAMFWLEYLEARADEKLVVYLGWQQFAIVLNLFGQIFSLLLIGIGVSELYSTDKELGMEELYLSYPYGRSLSTNIKIAVTVFYSLGCGILTCILSFSQLLIDGGAGANDFAFTLLGLQNTPFNISIVHFCIEWCIYHIVGCICVGLITLYISSFIHKKAVALFVPIMMFVIGIISTNTISQLGYENLTTIVGMVINPTNLLNGGLIKTNFENVSLDLPFITIPYYIIAPIFVAGLSSLSVILLKKRISKLQA